MHEAAVKEAVLQVRIYMGLGPIVRVELFKELPEPKRARYPSYRPLYPQIKPRFGA
jgi:hypothetical protein